MSKTTTKVDFPTIERLIDLSRLPLPDPWLEALQHKFEHYETYYRFLYHLVIHKKPRLALEIGTYFGIGSAYMAAAAKTYGGRVIGIDVKPHEMTKTLINEVYDNYHFLLGDSRSPEIVEQVNELVLAYGPIGIVYQDSSHHYEASRQEWAIYSRLLDAYPVWVCDDIMPVFHDPKIDPPGKGMVQYFEELPGDKRLYRDVLHFGNVQGVVLV